MKTNQNSTLPVTIEAILNGLGRNLSGARIYVGASALGWRHPEDGRDYECRGTFPSVFDAGNVLSTVCVFFLCNGKPGEGWKFFIAYEPDDTFSVWLVRTAGDNISVISEHRDVYIDALKHVVETAYDDAIKEFNGGFISLG
jgi:hypothetical protein